MKLRGKTRSRICQNGMIAVDPTQAGKCRHLGQGDQGHVKELSPHAGCRIQDREAARYEGLKENLRSADLSGCHHEEHESDGGKQAENACIEERGRRSGNASPEFRAAGPGRPGDIGWDSDATFPLGSLVSYIAAGH
jgi:hypothetical protein